MNKMNNKTLGLLENILKIYTHKKRPCAAICFASEDSQDIFPVVASPSSNHITFEPLY